MQEWLRNQRLVRGAIAVLSVESGDFREMHGRGRRRGLRRAAFKAMWQVLRRQMNAEKFYSCIKLAYEYKASFEVLTLKNR